ncbi:MAG: DUF6318 family protein [Actinomycetaceae bacterium]|nr:DUF6318 family protein [Actinomycetaceae bacterium]
MSRGPQSQRPSGNTPHRPDHRRGGRAGGEQAGSAALVERDDGEAGDDQGVWYEHVNLTGKDLFRALLWANGIVIAVCVFHAVMFLPPYGVLYDGPARPGHLEHHATDKAVNHLPQGPVPHTGNAQGGHGGGQSDSGLAQSTVQAPHPPNNNGSGDAPSSTGRGDAATGTGTGSQSAAPPSSTSTDTPLPEKPNTPHNLDENAAADLAHYYASVLTYSADTGDTAPLEDIFHPTCEECTARVKQIRDLYNKQGRIEQITYAMNGEITTSQAQSPDKTRTFWFVQGQLAVSEHTVTDLQSRKRHPASQTPTTLALCQHNTQWKICAIRQEVAQQSR